MNRFDPASVQDALRTTASVWGRTWCEVDLAALERNFSLLSRRLPAGGKMIVSAKKDAYGHGVLAVAERLGRQPAFGALGLATTEEILFLREHGHQGDVIIFCVLSDDALDAAIRANAILSVTTLEEARAASAAAARLGLTARAHLKIDTGMGRLGHFPADVLPDVAAMRALPALRIEGIYTHLPNAWDDPAQGRRQWTAMSQFAAQAGLSGAVLHIGGSDSLAIGMDREQNAWLRLGIAVYGDHPAEPALEPVMTLKSRVIYRRSVPAGATISYGGTFVTARQSELAIVGIGYGNGYLRNVSGKGAHVLLRGRRCPLLGRVCMDQIIIDVTESPDVAVGDEAVLFGRQLWDGAAAIYPASELARMAGTISYEFFCLAGQINPRNYLR